jgi:hypothetical protein
VGSSESEHLPDPDRFSTWLCLRDATGYGVDASLTLPGCVFEHRSIDSQRHKRVEGRNRATTRELIANAINERAASLRSPRFVVSSLGSDPEVLESRYASCEPLGASERREILHRRIGECSRFSHRATARDLLRQLAVVPTHVTRIEFAAIVKDLSLRDVVHPSHVFARQWPCASASLLCELGIGAADLRCVAPRRAGGSSRAGGAS